QRLYPVVDSIEEATDQAGIEVLLEAQIEQHAKRIAPGLARDAGDRAVGEAGILWLHWRRHHDSLPVALEHSARLRVAQIGAEPLAKARVAEHRLQLLAVIRLDRVERRMAVERVGAREREIERQR